MTLGTAAADGGHRSAVGATGGERRRVLAIVGAGPMGTYALAQLAAELPHEAAAGRVRVVVFEGGGRFGAGEVHSDRQPRTSYLNRVAGQITFAPDESARPPVRLLPPALRPTFLQWCRTRHAETGDPDFDLRPEDVPRRYVHGLALRDVFDRFVGRLRATPGVEVDLHACAVVDVVPGNHDGHRFLLRTEDPAVAVPADDVLFATGHSWNRYPGSDIDDPRWVPYAYPLDVRVTERSVPPGRPVLVRGLGLTALDVVLHLTEGRGGRFTPSPDDPGLLRYLPSGREPSRIIGISPSGVPGSGRPRNDKLDDPALEHRSVFFTETAVDRLRLSRGLPDPRGRRPRLDFELHLLPLVVLEMAYVHHRTLHGEQAGRELRDRVDDAYQRFLSGSLPHGEEGADLLLHAARAGDFDWRAALDPLPADLARPGVDWHDLARARLARDLAECREGNVANPVKAACDGVWRDLRAVFSAAVDDGGLTPESHRRFTEVHLRHYNRLSNGAGIEPMRKLLALVEAGLVDLSVGPDPVVRAHGTGLLVEGRRTGVVRAAEVAVEARVHPFDPWHDASPLYRNLLRRGLVRQWRNPSADGTSDYIPGALDLTEDFHPVRPDGSVEDALTFLGAPAEGLRVFQLTAARPGSNSAVLNNAASWAVRAVARSVRR
ncbi:FAD/NAD(P)-binding protein [Saccharothrix isguenensis]